ncbi:MAG: hypothetical protein ACR2NX_14555 [Chthoniobacterales bacterium]
MTPEIQKLFRVSILRQLIQAGRLGASVNELMLGARSEGFGASSRDDVREEIEYLTEKGHCSKLSDEISPEVESFKATAAGRDYMAAKSR